MSHSDERPIAGAETRPESETSAADARAEGSPIGDGATATPDHGDTQNAPAEAENAQTIAEEGSAEQVGAESKNTAEVAPAGPKMVRRVVVTYQLGWLPGDWLQTWRRLDRTFARADLRVKATLAPLEDLPKDTDILVVPPELREAAREAVPPGTPILVTPAGSAAGAFADLVSRLQAGTEFTAEKVDPGQADKPKIVSYRGHTLID